MASAKDPDGKFEYMSIHRDDSETLLAPPPRRPRRAKARSANSCAACCTIFSAVGAIFLLIMGLYLRASPRYFLEIGYDEEQSAVDERSDAVLIAAGLYVVSMLVSAVFWYRSVR